MLINSVIPSPLSRPNSLAMEMKMCIGMGSSWESCQYMKPSLSPEAVQGPLVYANPELWSPLGAPDSPWIPGSCWPSYCLNVTVSSAWVCWVTSLWAPPSWVLLHSSCVSVLLFCAGGPLPSIFCLAVCKQYLCLQKLWCTCAFPFSLILPPPLFLLHLFANKTGKMK